MNNEIKSTAPKPFVFVLMPFKDDFDNIYKYGIKGTAEKVGAYAERVDEQNYIEGTLDRIFNQISKADVIVADMTGRNANVYYEVGYAHALGKIVLLLTQNANDIPFDLIHRPHTIYAASKIDKLEEDLTQKLIWAIGESSRKGKHNLFERFLVSLPEVEIPEANSSNNCPIVEKLPLSFIPSDYSRDDPNYRGTLNFSIHNRSPETMTISFIYLFTHRGFSASANLEKDIEWRLIRGYSANEADVFESPDGLSKQFRIVHTIPSLPPEAVDQLKVEVFPLKKGITDELFKLRIHTSSSFHDFPFRIKINIT
jgi:hypothetical protein